MQDITEFFRKYNVELTSFLMVDNTPEGKLGFLLNIRRIIFQEVKILDSAIGVCLDKHLVEQGKEAKTAAFVLEESSKAMFEDKIESDGEDRESGSTAEPTDGGAPPEAT